jgi:hypothetical protein
MSRSRPLLVLLIAVVLGLSSVVPAEDAPETAYDESESLPYASTAMFSIAVPSAIVPVPVGRLLVALSRLGSLRRLGALRFEQVRGLPYPICDSLTILDHTLRC